MAAWNFVEIAFGFWVGCLDNRIGETVEMVREMKLKGSWIVDGNFNQITILFCLTIFKDRPQISLSIFNLTKVCFASLKLVRLEPTT